MKKKRYLKIFVIMACILTLTGCAKYGKVEKKVNKKKTEERIVTNILCRPTDKETLKLYEQYNEKSKKKVNIEKLPECKKMNLTGKYHDLWTNIFVKTIAFIIIQLGLLVKNYGLGLIIATLLIRLIAYPLTKKAAMQSENLKLAQPELEKLEKKYANKPKNDQQAMMQKSQEMMMIYKKYNINPMSTCLFSLFQIPLFFAFYEAIQRIPVIFEEEFLGFDLGLSPSTAVFQNGDYKYLIFIVIISVSTYFSFKLNSGASMNSDQQKQMKTMSNVMVIMMTIMAFSISTGIAFYWTTTSLFTIVQNLLVKRGKKNATNK
jgi:YidC/Oxa1 family membrane protein insertase